jgi:hypothetical protein
LENENLSQVGLTAISRKFSWIHKSGLDRNALQNATSKIFSQTEILAISGFPLALY